VDLARRLPEARLPRAGPLPLQGAGRAVEGLLLAAAGILPSTPTDALPASDYVVEAWELWRRHGAPAPRSIDSLSGQRPANHPARRLAGLARLIAGGCDDLLARARGALLSEGAPAALLALLTVEAQDAWADRLTPWGPLLGSAPALIGRGKALELALNAVLPMLLAEAERDHRELLAGAALRCFHALPTPQPYGRTAHLQRALSQGGNSLIRGADRSQGALYLWRQYCTRGGCGRCPLS
jgi:Protein of unknown function (DUF2851)